VTPKTYGGIAVEQRYLEMTVDELEQKWETVASRLDTVQGVPSELRSEIDQIFAALAAHAKGDTDTSFPQR